MCAAGDRLLLWVLLAEGDSIVLGQGRSLLLGIRGRESSGLQENYFLGVTALVRGQPGGAAAVLPGGAGAHPGGAGGGAAAREAPEDP